jgi:GTP cyclohydrolase II
LKLKNINEMNIKHRANADFKTKEYGNFIFHVFECDNGKEHIALIKGNIADNHILCRIASECVTSTVFNSATCECQEQNEFALNLIHEKGNGIFIYLRQEGRGHGLATKIQALNNKNEGLDTFQAVERLGLEADIRDYTIAVKILNYFNVSNIKLISNNPIKRRQLEANHIKVNEIITINIPFTTDTILHLKAKMQRGHLLQC